MADIGLSAADCMAAALLTIKNRSPWMFGTLLFLKRTPSPGMGTVGLTGNGRLVYDPEVVQKWASEDSGIEKLATVLEHEFLHIALKHEQRGRAMGLETSEEIARWNKAGDIALNPLLRDMGRKFPESTPPLFPEQFGFEVGLTAEGYYSRLKDKEDEDKKKGKPPPQSGEGPCSGNCCSQHSPSEDEGSDADDPQGAPLPTAPQMEQKLAEAQAGLQDALQKHRGDASVGILRTLDELMAPPKVRWDEKLRRLVSFHGEHKTGHQHPSFARMSKKGAGLGFGPGSARMPTYYAHPLKVGVVLDTSGSMGSSEMGSILPEAEAIIKQARGEITFLACDAAVNAMLPVRNVKELVANAKGGGGTSMLPAIRALQNMPVKHRPKLVVFFTDSYVGDIGPEPTEFKVIWCSTTSNTSDLVWGDVININGDA